MAELAVTVGIELADDAEADEVASEADHLRRELLELDVVGVERLPGGEAPPGSRGLDPVALGGLIVTVANSQLFSGVVAAIRSWLGARPQRSVKLEIDGDTLVLTGVSDAEQRRLADEWLARHKD